MPETEPRRYPRHVGIIMDGNGRWAERQGRPRLDGHRVGTVYTKDFTELNGTRAVIITA